MEAGIRVLDVEAIWLTAQRCRDARTCSRHRRRVRRWVCDCSG
jgi:hypothetical protein